jgi:hypothetical protein
VLFPDTFSQHWLQRPLRPQPGQRPLQHWPFFISVKVLIMHLRLQIAHDNGTALV